MNTHKFLFWIGKLLIIGAIVYFGVLGIMQPDLFARMIPSWLGFLPATTLVIVHGVIMTIAALLVFFSVGGKWAYYVLLGSLAGVLISVSGMTLVRDIAIIGAVIVLFSSRYLPRK